MEITARCREISMAECLLDEMDRCAVFHRMTRVGMSERVNDDVSANPCPLCSSFDDAERLTVADSPSFSTHEHRQVIASLASDPVQSGFHARRDEDRASLSALA